MMRAFTIDCRNVCGLAAADAGRPATAAIIAPAARDRVAATIDVATAVVTVTPIEPRADTNPDASAGAATAIAMAKPTTASAFTTLPMVTSHYAEEAHHRPYGSRSTADWVHHLGRKTRGEGTARRTQQRESPRRTHAVYRGRTEQHVDPVRDPHRWREPDRSFVCRPSFCGGTRHQRRVWVHR